MFDRGRFRFTLGDVFYRIADGKRFKLVQLQDDECDRIGRAIRKIGGPILTAEDGEVVDLGVRARCPDILKYFQRTPLDPNVLDYAI